MKKGLASSTPIEAEALVSQATLSVDDLRLLLRRATDHLLSLQKKVGFWEGEVFDNVTITAEYLLFRRFIRRVNGKKEEDAVNYILSCQLDNGSWNLFYDGPGELNATVESYQALKLAGLSKNHPALKKARRFIFSQGGLSKIRIFTRINLALFGQYPWDKIPQLPPELMLIPKELPFNVFDFSSWSRSVIIPLMIIMHHRPNHRVSPKQGIGELYDESPTPITYDYPISSNYLITTERLFQLIDLGLHLYNLSPIKPFRKKALKLAEEWILSHQDRSGYWGGIFPAMINSVIALILQGYSHSHPAVYHGIKAIDRFSSRKNGTYRVQSTVSPVWDTAITLYALMEAGVAKKSPAARKAARWLLRQQIRRKGDWSVKNPGLQPGGWPFEYQNDFFPDNDDTALVLLALQRVDLGSREAKKRRACKLGLNWLLGMQCKDGGWGAFDKDNNRQILNDIPFADLKSLLDPSSPDVTGHVLEILGRKNYNRNSHAIQQALTYLKRNQKPDGSWYGRWGVNFVYGTSAVLVGLEAIGENMQGAIVTKAVDWLLSIQNHDGGWGESCSSYDVDHFVASSSTPSQTAWALLGLLAADHAHHAAVTKGLAWLAHHQNPDGSWEELYWTGTGFPRHFYLRYDMYRLYFPTLALARAIKQL